MARVSYLSTICVSTFISLVGATPVTAVLITVNGTTVFHDGFEGGAVGTQPAAADPGPGTWIPVVGAESRADIFGPSSGGPGAKFGDQYLRMYRKDAPNPSTAFAPFTVAINPGDALHFEAWLWIDHATDHGVFLGFESDDLASRAWISTAGTPADGGGYRTHAILDGAGGVFTNVTYTTQQWQLWTLDYVVGSGVLSLSVDGVSQSGIGPTFESASPITKFRLGCSNYPDHLYYVDGDSPSVSHPGDFDVDGDVDGADFVAWQTHFPTASGATLADGDADGDGDVDGADFVVWQTNFPFTSGTGITPIPEPHSILMTIVGGIAMLVWRRRAQ